MLRLNIHKMSLLKYLEALLHFLIHLLLILYHFQKILRTKLNFLSYFNNIHKHPTFEIQQEREYFIFTNSYNHWTYS